MWAVPCLPIVGKVYSGCEAFRSSFMRLAKVGQYGGLCGWQKLVSTAVSLGGLLFLPPSFFRWPATRGCTRTSQLPQKLALFVAFFIARVMMAGAASSQTALLRIP